MDLNTINEEWCLEQLKSAACNVTMMVQIFDHLIEEVRDKAVDEWAPAVFQKLTDAEQIDQALEVIE